jgi:lipopolysaccharide biosynthesis glycosyltransferase
VAGALSEGTDFFAVIRESPGAVRLRMRRVQTLVITGFMIVAGIAIFSLSQFRYPHFGMLIKDTLVDNRTNLAVCWFVSDSHLAQALVSIYSVAKVHHNPNYNSSINIFIFNYTQPISPSNQAKLDYIQSINPSLPVVVHAFPMHFTSEIKRNMTVTHYGANAADYYVYRWVMVARLFLPRLLTHELILYLDGDTICGRDFSLEIEEFLSPSKIIYGVIDIGTTLDYMRRYFAKYNFNLSRYMNTGVMFLRNGPLLREYFDKVIKWADENYAWYPDQDGVNAVFPETLMELLPKKFNCHCCKRERLSMEVFHHGRFLRLWGVVEKELEDAVANWKP